MGKGASPLVYTPSFQQKYDPMLQSEQSAETSMGLRFSVDFGNYQKVEEADLLVINDNGKGRP